MYDHTNNYGPEGNTDHTFEYNNGFKPGNNGFAFAALILGVSALFSICTVYLPLILGSLAIIFALLSKGYGKKMVTTAKVGFVSAITGLSAIVSLIGIFLLSLWLLLVTCTDQQLLQYAQQMDQTFEAQTGQSVEDTVGMSYEDMMDMLLTLREDGSMN